LFYYFVNFTVATRFLKSGEISVGKFTLRVLPPSDDRELYITDIHEDIAEYVEDCISHPKKGGGPIDKYTYDDKTKSAHVVFSDANGRRTLRPF